MPGQILRGDGRHVLDISQPGHAEGIPGAHAAQQPGDGVDPLVVPVGLNGGNQIFLFAFHEIRQESPLFLWGIQQQLPQKFQHGLENPIPGQGKPVVHKAAVKAGGLVVPHPAHQGAHRPAVKFIQPLGHRPQVGTAVGAPQEHRGKQGVFRRLRLAHGPHQLKAEASLLESGIPAAAQGHAGGNGGGLHHSILLKTPKTRR